MGVPGQLGVIRRLSPSPQSHQSSSVYSRGHVSLLKFMRTRARLRIARFYIRQDGDQRTARIVLIVVPVHKLLRKQDYVA